MDIALESFYPVSESSASNIKAKLANLWRSFIDKIKNIVTKIMNFLHISKDSKKTDAAHKKIDDDVAAATSTPPKRKLTPEELFNVKFMLIGPAFKAKHWDEACKEATIKACVTSSDGSQIDISDVMGVYNTLDNLLKLIKDIETLTVDNVSDIEYHVKKDAENAVKIFKLSNKEISVADVFKVFKCEPEWIEELKQWKWPDCEGFDSKAFMKQIPKNNIMKQRIKDLRYTPPYIPEEMATDDLIKVSDGFASIMSWLGICSGILNMYIRTFNDSIVAVNNVLLSKFKEYVKTPEAKAELEKAGLKQELHDFSTLIK